MRMVFSLLELFKLLYFMCTCIGQVVILPMFIDVDFQKLISANAHFVRNYCFITHYVEIYHCIMKCAPKLI